MKHYYLFICACILSLMFSLAACNKVAKTSCYVCTATSTISGIPNSADKVGTASTTKCGLTAAEAQQAEKDGTKTETSSSGNITVTNTIVTKCVAE